MNNKEFLNLVFKYKWLAIAVPTITLIVTFFFVKNLPKEYKSQAELSTGLLDPSRQVAPDVPSYSGPDLLIKLNQQFTNIIDIMTMSRNMSILSYRLILHDLKNPNQPFKPLSDDIKALTPAEKQEAIALFEQRLENKQVLTPLDNYKIKLYNLVKSMGYDEKTLSKKLAINHELNSDFITVEFTSNNTLLSVFVVNTFSNDFINNYSLDLVNNKNTSINVLDSLLRKKEAVMNQKNLELKAYKIKNGILNLDKQSQIVYQQIIDNENKKAQALIDQQSLRAALKNVNDNLNNRHLDKYLGAQVADDNQAITTLKSKMQAAESNYLDGGYKAADKSKVDSLKDLLSAQLVRTNDNYVSDPLVAKQTLIQRRIAIGIDLEKTNASIKDINDELAKLNAKFNGMVPFDAGVQNYERNADVATREYLDILNRFNQTNLDKNIGLRLQLAQEGVPSTPESSKKPLYMALSFIASCVICFVLLFIIYITDRSIANEKQLRNISKGEILGKLNFIKPTYRAIDTIWKNGDGIKNQLQYKNLVRALRFDIQKILSTGNLKVFGITRVAPEKLNCFAIVSLAYAFARLQKKVLLIGDDELASEIVGLNIPTKQSLKELLNGATLEQQNHITFLNKDLAGQSLLENRDMATVNQLFNGFKNQYDLVLVHLSPINTLSDLKEWILFTDKYMATFMAGNAVTENDVEAMVALNSDEKFVGWLLNGAKQK